MVAGCSGCNRSQQRDDSVNTKRLALTLSSTMQARWNLQTAPGFVMDDPLKGLAGIAYFCDRKVLLWVYGISASCLGSLFRYRYSVYVVLFCISLAALITLLFLRQLRTEPYQEISFVLSETKL